MAKANQSQVGTTPRNHDVQTTTTPIRRWSSPRRDRGLRTHSKPGSWQQHRITEIKKGENVSSATLITLYWKTFELTYTEIYNKRSSAECHSFSIPKTLNYSPSLFSNKIFFSNSSLSFSNFFLDLFLFHYKLNKPLMHWSKSNTWAVYSVQQELNSIKLLLLRLIVNFGSGYSMNLFVDWHGQ